MQLSEHRGLKSRRHCAGMTLVEVSVVLIILAFALGAAMLVANATLEAAKVKATKTKQEAIKVALSNFIATQYRLPCPAVPTAAEGSAGYGLEATNPPNAAPTCPGVPNFTVGPASNRIARGVVPWTTLGLPDEGALDGYGHRFTYQVLRSQTDRRFTAATITNLTGNIVVYDTRSGAGGNRINPNAPAVVAVISHGKNGWGGYLPITGTQLTANGGDPDEDENTDNDLEIVDRPSSQANNDSFDDLVMWLSPQDLLGDLQRTGVIETQAAQTKTTLEQLEQIKNALVAYIAADNADPAGARTLWRRLPTADRIAACNPVYYRATPNLAAGSANDWTADQCLTGNVPYTTMGLPSSAVTDLWGNLIRYTVANDLAHTTTTTSGLTNTTPDAAGRQTRPFNGNSPGNPTTNTTLAFTLAASGDDGAIGTADDVTLTVTVAQLRGYVLAAGVTLN